MAKPFTVVDSIVSAIVLTEAGWPRPLLASTTSEAADLRIYRAASPRIDRSDSYWVDVETFEPRDSVWIDSSEVGLNEDIGHKLGVIDTDADRLHCAGNENMKLCRGEPNLLDGLNVVRC